MTALKTPTFLTERLGFNTQGGPSLAALWFACSEHVCSDHPIYLTFIVDDDYKKCLDFTRKEYFCYDNNTYTVFGWARKNQLLLQKLCVLEKCVQPHKWHLRGKFTSRNSDNPSVYNDAMMLDVYFDERDRRGWIPLVEPGKNKDDRDEIDW